MRGQQRNIINAALIVFGATMAAQWAASAQPGQTFEVAWVGTDGASPRTARYKYSQNPQRIAFEKARVGDIMAFAYGFPPDRIERRPQWMYDDLFNVAVTTAAPASLPDQKLMLQKLLEERFGLAVHKISTPSPLYYLVPGAKVNLTQTKEVDAADVPQYRIGLTMPAANVSTARHMTMSDLAAWLYSRVQLPVLDKTGITGFFDIEIPGLPIRPDSDRTIRAVRDALGLELELHRGTADSLIIDHAEEPRPN